MATTPFDMDAFAKALAQELQNAGKEPGQDGNAGQPPTKTTIPVNWNGQQLEFSDQESFQKFLDDQRTAMTQAASDAAARARAEALAEAQKQVPTTKEAPKVDEHGLTPEVRKFIESLIEDPQDAIGRSVEAWVEKKHGIKDPFRTFGAASLATVHLGQQVATEGFLKQNQEFDPNRHAQIVEKVRNDLGLPVTSQGLDIAWKYAKGAGMIQDNPQPSNVRQMPTSASSPFLAPPHPGRSGGGASAPPAVDLKQAEALDKDALNRLLARMQQVQG